MKVSLIVPAFNEEKMLPRSLAAINAASEAFHAEAWETELVVCNNNSTDKTEEVAQTFGAKVAFEPINQISRARNRGAESATGDWFVFVDADSFPGRALFARVADEIKTGKYAGGGCLVSLDEARPFTIVSLILALWNLTSRLRKWAAGSFIFCQASVFRKLGGFSPQLYVTEELEFSKRLNAHARRSGKKVKIISDVRLLTSARKLHLYSKREHFRFLVRALFFQRRVIRTREECHVWYDGRR
jgi:glycosyltransferase involved in cell wall biosynthesis